MAMYRQSQATETVVILRAIGTTTTISAFGSADAFTIPGTEFGDDEEIMVAGALSATDGADLSGQAVQISLDGAVVGTTNLYGYDGLTNYYQFNLGILLEGIHDIEARFLRVRI